MSRAAAPLGLCILFVAVALAMAACGSSVDKAPTNLADSTEGGRPVLTSEVETVPTETKAPVTPWSPSLSWRFDIADDDGNSRHGQIDVGKVSHLGAEPTLPRIAEAGGLDTICGDIDEQRDGVMPARVQLTNTSPGGFKQDLSLRLYQTGEYASGGPGTMKVAAVYGDGTRCDTIAPSTDYGIGYEGEPWGMSWQDVEPGKPYPTEAYLIIADYFTPAEPNGSSEVLNDAQLILIVPGERVLMDPSSSSFEAEPDLDGSISYVSMQLDGTPRP